MHPRFRRYLPTREAIASNRWLRWLGPHLLHPQLWHFSRRGVAIGVSVGVFFGLLIPIAQIPFAAGAAVLLRGNVPVAIGSTLVTNPVTFAPIYFAAYKLGSWITRTPVTQKSILDPRDKNAAATSVEIDFFARLTEMGKPLVIGLMIMASLMGLASYATITLFWRWRVMSKRRRRSLRRHPLTGR